MHHERRAKYLGLARNQTMIPCRVRTYCPYTNCAVVTRMQVCAIKKLLHASTPAMSFYHFLFLNTEKKLEFNNSRHHLLWFAGKCSPHICYALNSENGCQEKHRLAHAFHDPPTGGSVPAMESCVGTKKVGMSVMRA